MSALHITPQGIPGHVLDDWNAFHLNCNRDFPQQNSSQRSPSCSQRFAQVHAYARLALRLFGADGVLRSAALADTARGPRRLLGAGRSPRRLLDALRCAGSGDGAAHQVQGWVPHWHPVGRPLGACVEPKWYPPLAALAPFRPLAAMVYLADQCPGPLDCTGLPSSLRVAGLLLPGEPPRRHDGGGQRGPGGASWTLRACYWSARPARRAGKYNPCFDPPS